MITGKPGDDLHRERVRVASWRTVLTTKDEAKAFYLAREIGDEVPTEEITPRSEN